MPERGRTINHCCQRHADEYARGEYVSAECSPDAAPTCLCEPAGQHPTGAVYLAPVADCPLHGEGAVMISKDVLAALYAVFDGYHNKIGLFESGNDDGGSYMDSKDWQLMDGVCDTFEPYEAAVRELLGIEAGRG